MDKKRFTFIESPFKGDDWSETMRNHNYTKACVGDCLTKGERPYASHLFFTQRGILDDRIKAERDKGVGAGKDIEKAITIASKYDKGIYVCTAVYTNLGISKGMEIGIENSNKIGREVVYRTLEDDWEERFKEFLHSKEWMDLGLF